MSYVEPERLEALWTACRKWVEEHQIGCEEDIHQSDRAIEGAYELMEIVTKEVGFDVDED